MSDPTMLLAELEETSPNAHVIATHIVNSANALGRPAPAKASLSASIIDVLPESHLAGASVVKVLMQDENLVLLRSGFFGSADDKVKGKLKPNTTGREGRLATLEINYPEHSKYWWVLSTLSVSDDGALTLTFIDRIVDELETRKGPYKANRLTMTRAEFLRLVTNSVDEVRFHSEQLDKRQPIDPVDVKALTPSSKSKSAKGGKKHVGIGANWKTCTVKGQIMTQRQAATANLLLKAAHDKGANEAVTAAIIFAGIWESSLSPSGDNGTYAGALSGRKDRFPNFASDAATLDMANCFLVGGKGFTSAIQLNQHGEHNPAAIASHAEGAVPFDSHGISKQYEAQSAWPGVTQAVQEAKGIVQAGGGAAGGGSVGGGTTVEVVQPYNFQIGTSDNVNEKIWDGAQRLAQEVNWALFTDGPDLYYDAQTTLIKQKAAKVVGYGDSDILSWNFDWNSRQMATQFTLTLLCDPFEYRAGDVFIVKGFGIDEASTAGRPGAWLVEDAVRQSMSFSTQFTLTQPSRQKNEPAPQVVEQTIGGSGGQNLKAFGITGGATGVAAAVTAAQVLSSEGLSYLYGGGHRAGDMDKARPGPLDCSGTVCWILHRAGMFPGSTAAVSGALAASWGQPGQGRQMTVWANAVHCFIEFKLPKGHFQANTSGLGPGPRFGPWGGPGAADAAGGRFTPRHWPGT